MLQTSTTDSEFNLFPIAKLSSSPLSVLNADEELFYNSIKNELNKISYEPSQQAIDNILNYSKSL